MAGRKPDAGRKAKERSVFPERLTAIRYRGRVALPSREEREPDVLKLVPPTEDIVHLEQVWALDEHTSPLTKLELWRPTDPADKFVRAWLLDFGAKVLAFATRTSRGGRR